MENKRTVFIIPGYKHTSKNRAYKKLVKMLRELQYRPVLVNISWEKNSILKNIEQFLKQYKKIKTRKKYILGFSFGAMIAFAASAKVTPSGIILCSLSPYFKEDVERGELSCSILAKKIKAKKIHMLYGTKEDKKLIARVRKTYKQISKRSKYLVQLKKVEHNIGDFRYLNKIHQIAKELN